jgi:hypothetical protein
MAVKSKVAAALAVLSLTVIFQSAMATNDPPASGGWVSGDWTVTDSRTYSNVDINIDHGNLIIRNGGFLTLDHANLYMWMDASGQFYIEVQSGGKLVVKGGSTIACAQSWLRYYFIIRDGAMVSMGNSTVRNAGYQYSNSPVEDNGIYVASENVAIDSCSITDAAYGVYIDGVNARVSNSVFRNIDSYGIWVERSRPVLSGDDFAFMTAGIYSDLAGPVISRCSFSSNYYGVYVYKGDQTRVDNSTFTGQYYDGVYATGYSTVDVRDSTFTGNGPWDWWYGGGVRYNEFSGGRCYKDRFKNVDYGNGIVCDDSSSPSVDNCDFETSYRPGIYADYHAAPRISNCTISTHYEAPIISGGSASPEVTRCTLNTDWGPGVSVYGYGSMNMADTTIRAQNNAGMNLYSSADVTVRTSSVSARYDGIDCSRSTLRLYRSIINSTDSTGIYGTYGCTILIDDNSSVNGAGTGVYVYSTGAYARLRHSSVNGKWGSGMVVTEAGADIEDQSSVSSTYSYGLYSGDNGTVNSYNSTITSTSSSYVYLDSGGQNRYSFVNTVYDPFKVVFTEPTSVLNNSYYLDIAVQWQNGAPVPNASVTVTNSQHDAVVDVVLGEKGETGWNLVRESSHTQPEWLNFTPLDISAARSGLSKTVTLKSLKSNALQRMTLVDPDPPKVAILSPPNNAFLNSSLVGVAGTAGDSASGLAKVEFMTDGGSWAPVNGMGDWNVSIPLADGKHLIRARAFDNAGISVEASVSVVVDTVISLDVAQPADGAYIDNNTVTVSGTAEPFSNVSVGSNLTVVESDGAFEFALNLSDGPHDIAVTAHDAAGNLRTVARHIVVDTVVPALVLDNPANGTATSSASILFAGRTEPGAKLLIGGLQYFPDRNGSFSAMVPLVEGSNRLEVRSSDAAGNFNNTTVTVLLDTVPPALRVASPAARYLTNVPLLRIYGDTDGSAVLAGDVNATVQDGRFTVDFPLAEGINFIIVKALDEAGNSNATDLEVTLDTAPPFLRVITPAPGYVTNNPALTVTGITEPGALVTVNGLAAANDNGTISVGLRLAGESYTVSVKAVDGAGNIAYVNRTVVLDQAPPALSISEPSGGLRTPNAKVTVKGTTDTGSAVTVNGVRATVDDSGRFAAEVSLSGGDNSIVITSVDPAGNPTTKIVKVTRTGGLEIAETPMMLLGLLVGIVIGAVAGVVIGRRRRKEQTIMMAPEEPVPGRYDVPEEFAKAEPAGGQAAPAPPPPEYTRQDEAYHPPAPAAAAPEYRPPPWERRPDYDRPAPSPRRAPAEEPLASVPEAEAAPVEEVRPIERAPGERSGTWEEERPPQAKGAERQDRSLDDIMKRLRT